jgi:hypothetical protein
MEGNMRGEIFIYRRAMLMARTGCLAVTILGGAALLMPAAAPADTIGDDQATAVGSATIGSGDVVANRDAGDDLGNQNDEAAGDGAADAENRGQGADDPANHEAGEDQDLGNGVEDRTPHDAGDDAASGSAGSGDHSNSSGRDNSRGHGGDSHGHSGGGKSGKGGDD